MGVQAAAAEGPVVVETFRKDYIPPQVNLTGMLAARRLEWAGRILNGPEDSLPRIEILRLALAASIGVMTVDPKEVTIFYDSMYTQNAVAKVDMPIRRDSPNTAKWHHRSTWSQTSVQGAAV